MAGAILSENNEEPQMLLSLCELRMLYYTGEDLGLSVPCLLILLAWWKQHTQDRVLLIRYTCENPLMELLWLYTLARFRSQLPHSLAPGLLNQQKL